MVKLATASPFCVYRSSGSAVRFPTTVMTVSPAMGLGAGLLGGGGLAGSLLVGTLLSGGDLSDRLLRAEHLGAHDGLAELQLAVELLGGVTFCGELDDGVDALGLLIDLVSQTTTTPDVDVVDRSTVVTDDVEELVKARSHGALIDLGIEDDHQLVLMHD